MLRASKSSRRSSTSPSAIGARPVFQLPAPVSNNYTTNYFYSGTAYAPPPTGQSWWYIDFNGGNTGTGENTLGIWSLGEPELGCSRSAA